MDQINKLNQLIDQVEHKLAIKPSFSDVRTQNIERLSSLYNELKLSKNPNDFNQIFDYKAMNLTGISLQEETLGEIRPKRYVQIIAIQSKRNDEGKTIAHNSSLGYFGKVEKLSTTQKKQIMEFVLRWRYEKAFRHTDVYEELLNKLEQI